MWVVAGSTLRDLAICTSDERAARRRRDARAGLLGPGAS